MTNMFTNLLAIFVGSGLGGVCRYLAGNAVQRLIPEAVFPWGTLAVNVAGCLLIGFIYGLIDRGTLVSPQLRLLATVGFCGGFTTFSTFINENALLFGRAGTAGLAVAALYLCASLVLGFAALYAGHALVRHSFAL